MVMVSNELALELRAYAQFSASFSATEPLSLLDHIKAIKNLTKDKPVYILNIRRGDNPEIIIDMIRKQL